MRVALRDWRVKKYESAFLHNFKPVLRALTERLERKKGQLRDKQTSLTHFGRFRG
jgi:hypothetical protein